MSYTPTNQNIESPLSKILEGMEEFHSATNERMKDSREWTSDHLIEIIELDTTLQQLRLRIANLIR